MIGILGTTMFRFVGWYEPNRTFAQILKILVLVIGALALIAQLPREKAPALQVGTGAPGLVAMLAMFSSPLAKLI
jgi:hypothetical protein